MVMRHSIIRLTALFSLVFPFALATVAAEAQVLNPPQTGGEAMPGSARSPLSDNYVWDMNVVSTSGPTPTGPASGEPSPSEPFTIRPAPNDPTALAKRVEALEQYIRQ